MYVAYGSFCINLDTETCFFFLSSFLIEGIEINRWNKLTSSCKCGERGWWILMVYLADRLVERERLKFGYACDESSLV